MACLKGEPDRDVYGNFEVPLKKSRKVGGTIIRRNKEKQ